MSKKQVIAVFFTMLLVCILPAHALEKGTIYVDYHGDGVSLPYVNYGLYYLYTMDEDGDFYPKDAYEDLGDIQDLTDNEAWLSQGQTADNFISINKIQADFTGRTDEMGRAEISDLAQGVYLLKFEKKILDDMAYESEPILLVIPSSFDSDEEWVQSIVPKVEAYEEAELTFRDIIVLKTWRNDSGLGVRPANLTILLYKDGELFDAVLLNESNSWAHKWEDLDGRAEWALVEETVPDGYTDTLTRESDSDNTIFRLQNSYDYHSQVGGGDSVGVGGGASVEGDGYDTDVEGDLAQTGALMWPVPVLTICGVLFLTFGFLMRKEKHEETDQ